MKNGCFIIIYFTFCMLGYGQVGELERFDCNYSKGITVPFDYSESQKNIKPQLNQVVFYSYRDQFTYWYRITAKFNEKLNFKVAAMNDSDSYVVYVYQYNDIDFCNKLYQQKLKPIAKPFYVGYGSDKTETEYKTLNVQKENVYYISVLNTSRNNCGHYMQLGYNKDTLHVKALHLPCKKDVETLSLTQVPKPELVKKDSLMPPKPLLSTVIKDSIPKKEEPAPVQKPAIAVVKDSVKITEPVKKPEMFNTNFQYLIKDKQKLSFINANLVIVDLDNKERIALTNTAAGMYTATLEKDKHYKLKSTAFGYTDLELNVNLEEGNTTELLMEPLKVGDNFIMKSIYFHPNTYALRRESATELQNLLNYLTDNPSVSIEIQGHTNGDNRIYKNKANEGLGEAWNFQGSAKNLSLKRAEAIKTYLVNNGISAERLVPVGHGGSKPIIENPETMEEGQRNIRVEVVILKN